MSHRLIGSHGRTRKLMGGFRLLRQSTCTWVGSLTPFFFYFFDDWNPTYHHDARSHSWFWCHSNDYVWQAGKFYFLAQVFFSAFHFVGLHCHIKKFLVIRICVWFLGLPLLRGWSLLWKKWIKILQFKIFLCLTI